MIFEQIIIIYMLAGLFLMLPAFAVAHELFKEDKHGDLKIGAVVCIFGGPGVWMTLVFMYIARIFIEYVGKGITFVTNKVEECK